MATILKFSTNPDDIKPQPSASKNKKRNQCASKLAKRGSKALSDAELLGLALGVNPEAGREILGEFGSLRAFLNAGQQAVCRLAGIGQGKYARLQAFMELHRRFLGQELKKGDVLSDPDSVRDFLKAQLRDRPAECFCALFLDNRHRVIAFEELFYGTISSASVHPREVVRRAIHHNAAALILAHNHPSGVAEPSQADERITQRLCDALDLVDVRILDHFVVGDSVISFAERGLL